MVYFLVGYYSTISAYTGHEMGMSCGIPAEKKGKEKLYIFFYLIIIPSKCRERSSRRRRLLRAS